MSRWGDLIGAILDGLHTMAIYDERARRARVWACLPPDAFLEVMQQLHALPGLPPERRPHGGVRFRGIDFQPFPVGVDQTTVVVLDDERVYGIAMVLPKGPARPSVPARAAPPSPPPLDVVDVALPLPVAERSDERVLDCDGEPNATPIPLAVARQFLRVAALTPAVDHDCDAAVPARSA